MADVILVFTAVIGFGAAYVAGAVLAGIDHPRQWVLTWLALSLTGSFATFVVDWRFGGASPSEALLWTFVVPLIAAGELLRRWMMLKVITNAGREERRLDALFKHRTKDFSDQEGRSGAIDVNDKDRRH